MDQIIKQFKKVAVFAGALLGLVFIVFVLNQFINLYDILFRIHPNLALVVIILASALISYLLVRLIILWLRSPKNLVLKENPTDQEYEEYLDSMIYILKRNSHLNHVDWDSANLTKEEKVTTAFKVLDDLSMPIIKGNANSVFLTTAISQNGALDSIFVLINMIKMTWQLANVYQTRPSLKSLGKLYLQISGVVFMARGIEDADLIEEQLQPVIASVIGESITSAIPGMVPISNLIVSSIMEGSLNALLALRVGIIAQSYLGMELPQTRTFIRRQSTLQAIGYMGSILKDNAKVVVMSVAKAAKNTGKRTIQSWINPI